MKRLLPYLSLLLLLGLQVPLNATPPSVTFERPFNGQTHLISESGGIRLRAVASATDADPISLVSVLVTNLGDSTLVTSYVIAGPASTLALDAVFRPAEIGRYQFTALAVASDNENSRASTSITVTNVGRGERNYSQGAYKASHNSFDRSEPLDQQIDDYNVWQIELDCHWDPDNQRIMVSHAACSGGDPLTDKLDELNNSTTMSEKFTMIYLELTECDNWPDWSVYQAGISNAVATYLNSARVYTKTEFLNIDHLTWPSVPELLRRRKNFAIILNEYGAAGNSNHRFFFNEEFNAAGQDPIPGKVLISKNGGWDDGIRDDAVVDESQTANKERYLFRVYPHGPWCHLTDGEDSGDYWRTYRDRGFNFLASNCVDNEYQVTDSLTQAPEPTFVDASATQNRQWGTETYPYAFLDAALFRVQNSPMTTIKLAPGDYTVFILGSVISTPVVLKKDGSGGSNPIIRGL